MYGFNVLRSAGLASAQSAPRLSLLLSIVGQWVMRARGRRQLRRLLNDQRLLADIGLSRSVAKLEAERAFWDRAGR